VKVIIDVADKDVSDVTTASDISVNKPSAAVTRTHKPGTKTHKPGSNIIKLSQSFCGGAPPPKYVSHVTVNISTKPDRRYTGSVTGNRSYTGSVTRDRSYTAPVTGALSSDRSCTGVVTGPQSRGATHNGDTSFRAAMNKFQSLTCNSQEIKSMPYDRQMNMTYDSPVNMTSHSPVNMTCNNQANMTYDNQARQMSSEPDLVSGWKVSPKSNCGRVSTKGNDLSILSSRHNRITITQLNTQTPDNTEDINKVDEKLGVSLGDERGMIREGLEDVALGETFGKQIRDGASNETLDGGGDGDGGDTEERLTDETETINKQNEKLGLRKTATHVFDFSECVSHNEPFSITI